MGSTLHRMKLPTIYLPEKRFLMKFTRKTFFNPFIIRGIFSLTFIITLSLLIYSCQKNNQSGKNTLISGNNKDLPEIKWDFKRTDLDMEKAHNEISPKAEEILGKRPTQQKYESFLSSSSCLDLYKKYFETDSRMFVYIYNPEIAADPKLMEQITPKEIEERMSQALCGFVSDRQMKKLFSEVKKVYPETYDFRKILENPFRRMTMAIPDFKAPAVRTIISGYNPRADWPEQYGYGRLSVSKEYCAISLDYYAGDTFKILHPGIPKYLRRRCNEAHLPREVVYEYMNLLLPPPDARSTPSLLEMMLTEGKKLYAIDLFLPDTPDSIKFMCKQQEFDLAKNNIPLIYKKLTPLLFSSNFKEYQWVMNEGPFTHPSHFGMQGLPSRLGGFIGWQIIKSYMENNSDVSFSELLKERDFAKILKESGFKPKDA